LSNILAKIITALLKAAFRAKEKSKSFGGKNKCAFERSSVSSEEKKLTLLAG